MEVVCTIAQVLIVALAGVLFFVGVADIVGALGLPNNSPHQIATKARSEIEQIASEGQRAMDELSKQYLNEVYDQVTHQNRR